MLRQTEVTDQMIDTEGDSKHFAEKFHHVKKKWSSLKWISKPTKELIDKRGTVKNDNIRNACRQTY